LAILPLFLPRLDLLTTTCKKIAKKFEEIFQLQKEGKYPEIQQKSVLLNQEVLRADAIVPEKTIPR